MTGKFGNLGYGVQQVKRFKRKISGDGHRMGIKEHESVFAFSAK